MIDNEKEVREKREEMVKDKKVKKLVNNMIDTIGKNNLQVDAETVHNIARWVSSGMTDRDSLAYSLKISKKELDVWCIKYPEVMGALSIGEKILNMKVGLTLGQLALGGYKVKRQVANKLTEYNEEGKKVREYIEVTDLYDELPPNLYAVQYILNNKEAFDWGTSKQIKKEEEKQKSIVENLSKEDTLKVLDMMQRTQEEIETEYYVADLREKN